MPPTPVLPIASVVVYADGQGDYIAVDRGFSGFDIIGVPRPYHTFHVSYHQGSPRRFHAQHDSEGENLGTVTLDPRGKPLGQYIGRVGLKCRPYIIPQNTRLSDWSTSSFGGAYASSWDERRPSGGIYNTYRLFQFDSSPGVTWAAASNFQFPPNPNFCISIIEQDTPSDWNTNTLPPYYMIEFGGGAYAIYIEKHGGGHFLRKNTSTGKYEPTHTCSTPGKFGDADEKVVMIECGVRGRIMISFNFGSTWEEFGTDVDPFYVPQGGLRVSGQGMVFGFGLHQLDYNQFDYIAPAWSTFIPYSGVGLYPPVINGVYETPNGSSVVFTDISTPASLTAQYRARLIPGSGIQIGTMPFAMKFSPLLKSVNFRYQTIRQITGNTSSTPFDPYLMAADITYPVRLGDASATIRIKQDPKVMGLLQGQNWMLRKMVVKLGYLMSDNSQVWYTSFTGYLDTYSTVWDTEFREALTEIHLQSAAFRLKTTAWSPTDIAPLSTIWGGVPSSANAASDYVGYTEGLTDANRIDRSYMNWDPIGDTQPLPLGTPEQPFELIREGETKWETVSRLQSHAGCEAGADNNGKLFSLPINYIPPAGSQFSFRATSQNAASIREQLSRYNEQYDSKETVTAIYSMGQMPNNEWIMSVNIDNAAETIVGSGRFSRWRKTLLDKVKDPINPAVLVARANMLAARNFGIRRTPEFETPVNPAISRWQRVNCFGLAQLDMPDGTEFMVQTLHHSYRNRASLSTLRSSATVLKL